MPLGEKAALEQEAASGAQELNLTRAALARQTQVAEQGAARAAEAHAAAAAAQQSAPAVARNEIWSVLALRMFVLM